MLLKFYTNLKPSSGILTQIDFKPSPEILILELIGQSQAMSL